jgi:hypothetical protein
MMMVMISLSFFVLILFLFQPFASPHAPIFACLETIHTLDHYEAYIDFDELIRRTRSGDSSFNEPGSISFDDLRRM